MRCATHPAVETELRCATCGIPICPDCMVETPVGMKCRTHGLAPTPPLYQISPIGYILAILTGFFLAAIGGVFVLFIPFFFAALLLGPVGGRLIGDAISYVTGWKRGPRLAAVAAVTVALGAVSAPMLLLLARGGLLYLGNAWSALLTLDLRALLFGILAAVIAYGRIR